MVLHGHKQMQDVFAMIIMAWAVLAVIRGPESQYSMGNQLVTHG